MRIHVEFDVFVVEVVGEGPTHSAGYYSSVEHEVVQPELEVMVNHIGCFCG